MSSTWHVLPEDSVDLKKALNSVVVDDETVRAKMEEYLREVVVDRMQMLNLMQRIEQQLERRIEIAVKAAVDRINADMVVKATEQMRTRIKAEIDKLPISVSVTIGADA